MDPVEKLHREILEKVREYHQLRYGDSAPFEPEVTRIGYAGRVFDAEEMVNLTDAALDFWLTWGKYSREFEAGMAAVVERKQALLVNSGSSANLLALMALTSPKLGDRRLRRGDEVITVACGFPTTVAPIVQYGAVPVFIDVGADGNLLAAELEKARSPRTRAVMAAHSLGNPFDLDAVTAFCRKHDLFLIEDNCDALGSLYRGRPTGSFGDIGTSSFYPPHHLTMGEGGAVYCDDPQLYRILLSMRDWGRDCWCESGQDNSCGCRFSRQFGTLPPGYDHKYVYSHFGYNLKATDMQAAIGCAQLEKLPRFTAARRRNHAGLCERLRDAAEFFVLPEAAPHSDPSWFGFLLVRRDAAPFSRNDLAQHLEAHLIQTRNLFAGNLLRHPCCSEWQPGVDYRQIGELAGTDKIMNDALWIGVYPGMDEARLDFMAETILEWVKRK